MSALRGLEPVWLPQAEGASIERRDDRGPPPLRHLALRLKHLAPRPAYFPEETVDIGHLDVQQDPRRTADARNLPEESIQRVAGFQGEHVIAARQRAKFPSKDRSVETLRPLEVGCGDFDKCELVHRRAF